ncbi:transglutaminase domain-containing protein [Candidatus Woesearchaeota archaeon]|nr:transglutaminase domain-containing protein [Candidatus Woesearchaeota archaeon]
MKRGLLLLLLIVLPFASAQSNMFTSKDLISNMKISSGVELKSLGEGFRIRSVVIDNSFYPRQDWYQIVNDLEIYPDYFMNETLIRFEWKDPEETELDFEVSAIVQTRNAFVEVREKIKFPILNLPDEFDEYMIPRSNIDSDNRAIIETASNIVEGEDDLYEAVFKIADWVESSIDYSLDTLTSTVSQPASWVLDKRYGVCDELTSLFIALSRSVGIPARYISGVAYTNWNDLNDFGAHAWAEVYFPDVGWIPFDITYGEFGFVDASHIKLKESLDSDEASVNYRWEGWMADLETKELDISTETQEIGDKLEQLIEITASMIKDEVMFGSYNVVEVLLNNPNNFYVPTEVFISRSEGIETDEDLRKQVLLKPNQEKTIYWILKVDDDLEENYKYTFRVLSYTTRNASSETEFTASTRNPYFSLTEVREILEQRDEESLKTYSRNVSMNCTPKKSEYYLDETPKIDCTVKNNGNTYMEGLRICAADSCHDLSLGITQEKDVTIILNIFSVGKKEIDVFISNDDISKSDSVKLDMLDLPKIGFSNISFPDDLSYGEKFGIEFMVNKLSESNPQDIIIELNYNMQSKKWEIAELTNDRRFIVNLNTKNLMPEDNKFDLKVKYKDKNSREYEEKDNLIIKLENLSFIEKSMLYLNSVGESMEIYLMIALVSTLVFVVSVIFVFKKKRK